MRCNSTGTVTFASSAYIGGGLRVGSTSYDPGANNASINGTLGVGSTALFTNGPVGIGTAAPLAGLDVVARGLHVGSAPYDPGANNAAIEGTLGVGGGVIITNGNVGIGDVSPSYDLVVKGRAPDFTPKIYITSISNYQDLIIQKSDAINTTRSWGFGRREDTAFGNTPGALIMVGDYFDASAHDHYVVPIMCNSNADVIIAGALNAQNGNVGIGSLVPVEKLEVASAGDTKIKIYPTGANQGAFLLMCPTDGSSVSNQSGIWSSYADSGMTFQLPRDVATHGYYFKNHAEGTLQFIDSVSGDVGVKGAVNSTNGFAVGTAVGRDLNVTIIDAAGITNLFVYTKGILTDFKTNGVSVF